LQKTLSYITTDKKSIKLTAKNRNQQKTANSYLECVNGEIQRKIPVFTCSCGVRILIVPDLNKMQKAIDKHIVEHRKLSGQTLTEDDLSQQILKVIIETTNEI
jgi:hypothetical protein